MIHPEGNLIYWFLGISVIAAIVFCCIGMAYLRWKKSRDTVDDFKQYD